MNIITQEVERLRNLQEEILKRYPKAIFIHTEIAPPYATYIRFWDLASLDIIEWTLTNNRVYERVI